LILIDVERLHVFDAALKCLKAEAGTLRIVLEHVHVVHRAVDEDRVKLCRDAAKVVRGAKVSEITEIAEADGVGFIRAGRDAEAFTVSWKYIKRNFTSRVLSLIVIVAVVFIPFIAFDVLQGGKGDAEAVVLLELEAVPVYRL